MGGPDLELLNSVVGIKQRIAAAYAGLAGSFEEFPKATETWKELSRGELFQCEMLENFSFGRGLAGKSPLLDSMRGAADALVEQSSASRLRLDEAYQISLDLSALQLELMALMAEHIEFPQSLEVKNIATVMSSNLLQLYDMMEKSISAPSLRMAMGRNRAQLMALSLTFLEFDIKNYLTGVLGLCRLMSGETSHEHTRQLLNQVYDYCDGVRSTLSQLEKIRVELMYPDKRAS
jgi:nitrogen-specific signal transduction histidine kinase